MLTRRARAGRRGQVIVMFAISFAFFTFGLIVMVANLATIYDRQADAARAAQDGAQAGSADIDIAAFLRPPLVPGTNHGVLRLRWPAAKNLCESTINNELTGISGVTTASCAPADSNQGITATVTIAVPYTVGFGSVTVTRTYTAVAQPGTTTPVK